MLKLRTLYRVVGLAVAVFVLSAAAMAQTHASNGTTRAAGSSISVAGQPQPPSTTFYSDLGSPVSYNCCTGWTVSGTGTIGTSFTAANLFTTVAGGSVTQIDLGVGFVVGPYPFDASIWTDVGNLPGTQVPGASWTGLLSSADFGTSTSALVTIPVAGVSLSAGTPYFMILGPANINDPSWNAWNWNAQNVNGLVLYSTDGGVTWNSNGTGNPLGAFDVLGGSSVPEPGSMLLLGTALGLAALLIRKVV